MMITRFLFVLMLLGIVVSSTDVDNEKTSRVKASAISSNVFKNKEHVNFGGSGGYQWGWGGGGGGGVGGGSGSGTGKGGPNGGGGSGGGKGGGSTSGGIPGVGWGWGGGGGGKGFWKWGCGKENNGGGYQQLRNKKMVHEAKRWVGGYLTGEYAQCMGEESRCKGMKLECPLHCGGSCFYDCHHMCKAHCQR